MCGNTKERCMPTSRSSSPIFWHGGCVVDFPTTPINLAQVRLIQMQLSSQIIEESCDSYPDLLLHARIPVLARPHARGASCGELQLQLGKLKPAVAAVPAQAIQAPSAQSALAGFQLLICIGSLRLGQRPTWDLSPSDKFNSTLGYPGEGPVLKAGASNPMSVDVQAVASNYRHLRHLKSLAAPVSAAIPLYRPYL